LKSAYTNDIIVNLHNADALGWGDYFERPPAVVVGRRYEIARTIIGHHISHNISGLGNRRLVKSEKEKFVDNIIADFHAYGLFNQQKKVLVCKIAEIIANKDKDTALENKCLKTGD
ncbi:MAG: hypothetical protein AAB461_03290, partial [Patescibacteria group bacterium]